MAFPGVGSTCPAYVLHRNAFLVADQNTQLQVQSMPFAPADPSHPTTVCRINSKDTRGSNRGIRGGNRRCVPRRLAQNRRRPSTRCGCGIRRCCYLNRTSGRDQPAAPAWPSVRQHRTRGRYRADEINSGRARRSRPSIFGDSRQKRHGHAYEEETLQPGPWPRQRSPPPRSPPPRSIARRRR